MMLCVLLVMSVMAGCVKSTVDYGTSRSEIAVSPVTSLAARSVPGAIEGNSYPIKETMGIIAFHNSAAEPGPWDSNVGVTSYLDRCEFGLVEQYGAWGGFSSDLVDGVKVNVERHPYEWPSDGSLIFAGFSPYYKFEATGGSTGKLKPIKDMVSYDVATRTLSIHDYVVGQYVPMSAEQIADPDIEYANVSQSDLMFFMPQVVDGKYVGVNKMSSYHANFHHALSLVEFKVRAEDNYDVNHVHIDRIKLEQVYHTGDFTATIDDDGRITAEWTGLEHHAGKDVNIFGSDEPHAPGAELELDMDLRSVAQLLIIPGPTHRIKVDCHVYTVDRYYEQSYIIRPEEIGILNWEIGKRYVYNLIVGLNKLSFSPEVHEWDDKDGGDVTAQ